MFQLPPKLRVRERFPITRAAGAVCLGVPRWVLSLAAISLVCATVVLPEGHASASRPLPAGTQRMAERLKEIAARADPALNGFATARGVEILREELTRATTLEA